MAMWGIIPKDSLKTLNEFCPDSKPEVAFRSLDFKVSTSYASTSSKPPVSFQSIWRLPVQTKLHYFLWRLCHNGLSLAVSMAKRGVLTKTMCHFCKKQEEDASHLFIFCPFFKALWFSLNLPSITIGKDGSFIHWWQTVYNSIKSCTITLCTAVHCLWRIWKCRNPKIFKQQSWDILQIRDKILHDSAEFLNSLHIELQEPKDTSISSDPLVFSQEILTVTTDASWSKLSPHAGLGFAVRSTPSTFLATCASPAWYIPSPACAEALAIKEALRFCLIQFYQKIQLESDAASVIAAINSKDVKVQYGPVIKHILQLKDQFSHCALYFQPRANVICAHILAAKLSLSTKVASPLYCTI